MRVALVIAAFVVASLLVKAPQLLAPMGQDQGLYHAVAERILQGGVPYRDAWDPKPPGAFYVHAAVTGLIADPWRACSLGSLPGLSRSDLQPRCGTLIFEVVDAAYSLVLAALVFAVARQAGLGSYGAALAFGLTAIFINLALLDPEGSTPEKYALAPAVAVVWCGLRAVNRGPRAWFLVAGALAGVAVLFKQPDLASCVALSVWLLTVGRGRDLLWLWPPVVLVLGGAWSWLALNGAGAAFLDATVFYNLGRFGFQVQRIPLAGLGSMLQVFRDGMALLWLLAAFGAVVAWRTRQWRLLLIWAAFDVFALFLGGTKFTREYFVQLVPSFSLLGAAGAQFLWSQYGGTQLGRAWLIASVATIGLLSSSFQAAFALRVWNDYVGYGWTTTSVERLGSMIGALPPQDTVFVWGDEAQVYVLGHRQPPTRFFNTAGLAMNGDPAAARRRAEVFDTLTRTPPAVIVVDSRTADDDPDGRLAINPSAVPELKQLLTDHYKQMDGSVLRPYAGGGREQVYIRQGGDDPCAEMPGCRVASG